MNDNDSKSTARVVRTALLVAVGAAALFLSACNTVEGVGEDLQESSRNVKDAMSN
jgi:predicted small secreted protein